MEVIFHLKKIASYYIYMYKTMISNISYKIDLKYI